MCLGRLQSQSLRAPAQAVGERVDERGLRAGARLVRLALAGTGAEETHQHCLQLGSGGGDVHEAAAPLRRGGALMRVETWATPVQRREVDPRVDQNEGLMGAAAESTSCNRGDADSPPLSNVERAAKLPRAADSPARGFVDEGDAGPAVGAEQHEAELGGGDGPAPANFLHLRESERRRALGLPSDARGRPRRRAHPDEGNSALHDQPEHVLRAAGAAQVPPPAVSQVDRRPNALSGSSEEEAELRAAGEQLDELVPRGGGTADFRGRGRLQRLVVLPSFDE